MIMSPPGQPQQQSQPAQPNQPQQQQQQQQPNSVPSSTSSTSPGPSDENLKRAYAALGLPAGKLYKYSTKLPLTSTRWGQTTIKLFCTVHFLLSLSCELLLNHSNISEEIWEHRESNPGWQGGKRERYLCAMPTPSDSSVCIRFKITFFAPSNLA